VGNHFSLESHTLRRQVELPIHWPIFPLWESISRSNRVNLSVDTVDLCDV